MLIVLLVIASDICRKDVPLSVVHALHFPPTITLQASKIVSIRTEKQKFIWSLFTLRLDLPYRVSTIIWRNGRSDVAIAMFIPATILL